MMKDIITIITIQYNYMKEKNYEKIQILLLLKIVVLVVVERLN